MANVVSVNISERKGEQKHPVPEIQLKFRHGIVGDAHAGDWHRQISLLAEESVDTMRANCPIPLDAGVFAENINTVGIDLKHLPVGTHLRIGETEVEVTQIGKECHSHCEIYKKMGECIMPREGVFARVLVPGEIHVGDEMVLEPRTVPRPWQAAVVTLSDKGARGERKDESGPAIARRLEEAGYEVVEQLLLADEAGALRAQLIRLADQRQLDLILTTGGTGFGPRDITPEATLAVADRTAPGIAEAMRAASLAITPRAMLSRGVSVLRKKTLIINLPGSPKACMECMDVFMDTIPHAMGLLRGEVQDCARH